jgi:hypothetical protein
MNAPIAAFVRASDGRLFIKAWHSQLRAPNGVTGTQQLTVDGVPQAAGQIGVEAFEWTFPTVEDVRISTSISGSNSAATTGSVGPMQPAGTHGTASCTWQFAQGSTASPPPGTPQNTPPPVPPASNPGSPAGTSGPPTSNPGSPTTPPGPSTTNPGSSTGQPTAPPDTVRPTAVLDVPAQLAFGQGLTLSGARSSDVGGQIRTYVWQIDPGAPSSSEIKTPQSSLTWNPTAGPWPVGPHTVQLIVIDSSGNVSNPATATVTVVDQVSPLQNATVTPVLMTPTLALPAGTTPASLQSGVIQPRQGLASSSTPVKVADCQLPAPKLSSSIRVTPGNVYLTWEPVPDATGYTVSRRDLGVLTPTPIQVTQFTHNAPLDFRTTYEYTVSAQFAKRCGSSSQLSIPAPRPGTPVIDAVTTSGGDQATKTGTVRISWQFPGTDATSFLVLGPGLPQNGREVQVLNRQNQDGYQIDIDGVAPGQHTWLVTPAWDTPTGRMIDVGTGAQATATVGFYRLLITAIHCFHETYDNILELDGAHDEIYVAAAYTLNGSITFVKSEVHGDVSPPPVITILGGLIGLPPPPPRTNRIPAGSARGPQLGGIQTGDIVPNVANPALPSGPPSSTTFPFLVWEGWLGGKTAMTVNPTIWEFDGDPSNYVEWMRIMGEPVQATSSVPGPHLPAAASLLRLDQTQREQDVTTSGILKSRSRVASNSNSNPNPLVFYDRSIGGVSSGPRLIVTADGMYASQPPVAESHNGMPAAAAPQLTNLTIAHFKDSDDLGGEYFMYLFFQPIQ